MTLKHGQPKHVKLKMWSYWANMGAGEWVSRKDMAVRMSSSYSTAQYNLESLHSIGRAYKEWGYASDNQPGWLYRRVEDSEISEGNEGHDTL